MNNIWNLSLNEFTDATLSSSPTPGGGSVAAVSGTFGMGLVIMAMNISQNKNSLITNDEIVKSKNILARISSFVEKDIDAFESYMKALKLPKISETEILERKKSIKEANLSATNIPIEAAKTIIEAFENVIEVIDKIEKNVISDIGAGTYLLVGSLNAILLNIDINIRSIKDQNSINYFMNQKENLLNYSSVLSEKILKFVKDKLNE